MTTNELIEKHNDLARKAGLPELTEWKRSKHELEARIASIPPDPLEMEPSAPEPKQSVGAIVAELVMDAALSYTEVAERVRELIPGAATSAKSVASIALRLRKDGAVIPARSRGPLAGKE